ncbi:MAG: hypothetical protein OEV44_06970, partial [Spirochaetota bacterium]|nr:hypothetical protein [Spirochaetota bacterium]
MKRATIYFIAIFFSWIGINQGLSPSDGIETHGKEDSTSQKIGSNYFRQLGIPFNRWSHKHQNIKANKKLIMTLEFPSNVAVIIGLNKNGKDVNGNYFSTDVQDKGKMEQYKLQIFFPEKGEYTLMLFAKSKSAGGSFPYLTAYNITATEATTEEEIIFGGYAGNLFRTNSEWSKLGISLSGFSHKKDVIATTEDHVIITFKAKKDFPLYKNLKNEKNKNYESRIVDNYVDGEKRVIAFFPKPGKYRVELYSFPNGKYVPVAYYDVYTKKGISSNLALDKIMSPYLFKSKEWNETSFLNSRMEVKSIKLSNKIYHSAQKNGIVNILFCGLSNDGPPAPVIRFAQNGSSYLAWTDKKFITHVDKLNENQDIVQVGVIKLSNRLVYDMVVQKDGITLLT